MLELLFELLVSAGVCVVIAFFLFLGAAEDDADATDLGYGYDNEARLESTGNRPGATRSAGPAAPRRGALPRLWRCVRRSLHLTPARLDTVMGLYNSAWTALVGPNSVLGRDRDDEASGAIAEILSRRTERKVSRRPSAIDFAQEEREADAAASAAGLAGSGNSRAGSHRSSPTDVPPRGDKNARAKAPPLALNAATEGTQWLNLLGRWLAVLLLGGGTTQPQVWADRVQRLVVKGLGAANGKWGTAVATRRRNAALRTAAPRQLRARRDAPAGRRRRHEAPLLTFHHLSLGCGAVMAHNTHHLPTTMAASGGSVTNNPSGMSGGGGAGPASQGAGGASISMAQSVLLNAVSVARLHEAVPNGSFSGSADHVHVGGQAAGASAGGGSVASPALVSAGVSGGGGSGAPTGRRLGVPVDLSPSFHQTAPALDGDFALDASMLSATGSVVDLGATYTASYVSGPAVGIVLPRIAGDITSCECFQVTTAATTTAQTNLDVDKSTSRNNTNNTNNKNGLSIMRQRRRGEFGEASAEVRPLGAVGQRRSSLTASATVDSRNHSPARDQPPRLAPARPMKTASLTRLFPTRTFRVPIVYEDQHFQIRLGCSLPVVSLLPAPFNLIIPEDVLMIDGAIDIRHIAFHGLLHVAFRGPVMEISFPEAPRFTAVMSVSNPYLPASASPTHMWTGAGAGGSSALPSLQPQRSPQTLTAHEGAAVDIPGAPAVAGNASPSSSPSPLHAGAGAHHGGLHDRNEKMQEVVLNAIRSAVTLITYPKVLRAQPHSTRCLEEEKALPPASAPGRGPIGPAHDFSFLLDSDDDEDAPGAMDWTLATASLPLFTC